MSTAFRLRARGRAQRVGFRRFAQEVAREFGLAGWMKNLPDGSVQGPREAVQTFVERLRKAPAPIRVEQVLIEEVEPEPGLEYFRVIYGPLEEELQEGFGAMQNIFMEYWREFKDYRQEFRELARRMEERLNLLNDKLTTILETLVRESAETRRQLTEALTLLRQAVEKLLGEKAA